MKGAPEKVLRQCTSYYKQGSIIPLATKDWEMFSDAVAAMSSKGLRGVSNHLLAYSAQQVQFAFSLSDSRSDSSWGRNLTPIDKTRNIKLNLHVSKVCKTDRAVSFPLPPPTQR